ncbi:MAG: hypothetical protein CL675_10665 [Bdellovibrionaceae bacterium]|nr:hypothetical protein [Pseudobdellovibrionaceae bacterium]
MKLYKNRLTKLGLLLVAMNLVLNVGCGGSDDSSRVVANNGVVGQNCYNTTTGYYQCNNLGTGISGNSNIIAEALADAQMSSYNMELAMQIVTDPSYMNQINYNNNYVYQGNLSGAPVQVYGRLTVQHDQGLGYCQLLPGEYILTTVQAGQIDGYNITRNIVVQGQSTSTGQIIQFELIGFPISSSGGYRVSRFRANEQYPFSAFVDMRLATSNGANCGGLQYILN